MRFYLLHLRLNGIKNISKEIEFDFYNKIITSFNPDLYKIKAIYGENGSGKTAVMTAVNIAKKVMLSPDYLRQTETQTLLGEIINKKNNEFFIEFEFVRCEDDDNSDLDLFRYSMTLSKDRNDQYLIGHEKLDVIRKYTRNKKYKKLYETENGQLIYVEAEDPVASKVKEATQNILDDKTVATAVLEKNLKLTGLTFDIITLLLFFFYINVYLDEEDLHEMYLMNRILGALKKSGKSNNFTAIGSLIDKQLFYMDSKGRDIVNKKDYAQYRKKVARLEKFLKIFKTDLKSLKIDRRDDGDCYRCELLLDYGDYSVNREFESTGIKKLIRIYDAMSNVDRGGISFIDEMDSNLNDVYLCKLIEYFKYYAKGQLCFTTHNLDPMTILKDNRNSIDFLISDNRVVSWKITGNAAPDRYYRNGMIEHSPLNVDAIDFIGMFGE